MAELANLKWETFCLNYVKFGAGHGAGVKAAKASGYEGSRVNQTVWTLLAKPEIKERIREIMSTGFRRLRMDVKKALEHMTTFAERPPTGDAHNDRNTIQALVEVVKIQGGYKEKLEVSSGNKGIDLESLDLPLDVKKQILESIRKADKKKAEVKSEE